MGIFSRKNRRGEDAVGAVVRRCAAAYSGKPDWVSPDDGIFTVNFARTVCAETARLALLGTRISVSGNSARAVWLQRQLDAFAPVWRRAVELMCAYGTVILKPSGDSVDVMTPDRFTVLDSDGGRVTAAVFRDVRRGVGGELFERLEYHRFVGGVYVVSNRCVRGGRDVPLDASPWAGLSREVRFTGVSRPLFAVLRTPSANNLDPSSPLGLPIIADALSELCDLDVAVSRASREVRDSKRTVLIDSDRLMLPGRLKRGGGGVGGGAPLPDFVRAVFGTGAGEVYHEINPTLNTADRLLGIDAILYGIGVKCGFSSGYFVRGGKSGVMTATEVEANDRRTVEHIRDIRVCIESAVRELVYALGAFADVSGAAPSGSFELTLDFGDITYNRDEDRRRWYEYVRDGRVSFEYFLQRFEGESREGAAEIAGGARLV